MSPADRFGSFLGLPVMKTLLNSSLPSERLSKLKSSMSQMVDLEVPVLFDLTPLKVPILQSKSFLDTNMVVARLD
jgi:hypothetical protein